IGAAGDTVTRRWPVSGGLSGSGRRRAQQPPLTQPSAALNASAMAGPSTHAAAPTAIAMAATMMPYSTAVAPRSSYARISCSRAHNLIMEGPPDGWYLPSLTSPHGRKYGRTAAATDTAV